MSLVKLPYELVLYVVQHLDLPDITSVSFSCKKFQFLLQEASITKFLLESKAPFSVEAQEARASNQYAAGLRRLIKRREALASVSPYLVAVVAFAEEWLYVSGVLCYISGPQLRVLDLHHSGRHEMVVDIPRLLHEALGEARKRHTNHRLQLLHYSHGIVSCIHTRSSHRQESPWDLLVIFCPESGEIIATRALDSTSKLFVRNNGQFLYYGTTSAPGQDGYERWVLTGFDITARTWFGHFHIPAVIGTDVGSTVCFEILDGFFYCLSNQASLEVEEVDWVSYYTCFRFPLSRRGFRHVETPPKNQLWRRNQIEGPIDDRWTFLRMFRDEKTGELKAIESRKEWLSGRISARRTYYMTTISLDNTMRKGGRRQPPEAASSIISVVKNPRGPVDRPRGRDPHSVHPGDDSSTLTVTLSKCPIRSYYPSCQAYIDLVDDSTSFDPADQQIRIRGGSRRLWTPAELAARRPLQSTQGQEHQDAFMRQIEELYRSETGCFWPPKQQPFSHDAALADLYAVLNPPGYLGSPHGSWDERSLVYATGGVNKALIFVSWDPSIHLAGTAAYPGDLSCRKIGNAAGEGSEPNCPSYVGSARQCEDGVGHADSPDASPVSQPDATTPSMGVHAHPASWCRVEPARYRQISRGYHFAR